MSIRLFYPFVDYHALTFLEINNYPFKIVKKFEKDQIDFIVHRFNEQDQIREKNEKFLKTFDKKPKILGLDIFHNIENQVKIGTEWLSENDGIILTNAYDPEITDKSIIFIDFLFNLVKAYFSQYPFSLQSHIWQHNGEFSYILPSLINANNKNKIFVAPNKTYTNKNFRNIQYRPKIVNFLEKYEDLGYIGNIHGTPKKILYPHYQFPFINDINEIISQTADINDRRLFFAPVHNAYYNDTFLSIYAETIEYGNSTVITKKTYVPLIKGHFILPFSNQNFLKRLTSFGFKLPNFINYEYDSITDNDKRFSAYIEEARRLLSLNVNTWKQHWNENLDLLLHNKRIFHSRPYDRIDLNKLIS